VPLVDSRQSYATMQLTVNGAAATPRQLPLTYTANPSLFLSDPQTLVESAFGYAALALNADGSMNSSTNPAKLGSAVSVFLNLHSSLQLATTNGWSVTGSAAVNPFVVRVDLRVPSALLNNFSCSVPNNLCAANFALYDVGFVAIDELVSGGKAFGGVVYVNRTQ